MHAARFLVGLILLSAISGQIGAGPPETAYDPAPIVTWRPAAPPLPPPTGQVIRVRTVEELFRAAESVRPGGTILVADGRYLMPRYFELHTDRVTLRSESGRRERVVLDGRESRHNEILGITRASGVTVADLTVENIRANGIKINSNLFADRVTIRNCVIHNIWERGVKGPAVDEADRARFRPSDCVIEYCLFYNDRPKRYSDDPADTAENFGGNYVGGIDAMHARRWTIRDNVFAGIRGRTGAARGAVFLWNDAQECIVERNVIVDCDSGICLGNSHRAEYTTVHCTGCIVRNNFVVRAPENGILADYTRDCRIVHNTVHDPESRLKRLVRIVHDSPGLVVANNLLSGPEIRIETDDAIALRGNVTRAMPEAFVSVLTGNLHLTGQVPSVVDAAEALPEVTEDIDGERRDARPDVGADEVKK